MTDRTTGPVRVALVGGGYWGVKLCRVLRDSPAYELVWVCDADASTLSRVGHIAPAARHTTDVSHILEDARLQAVVIATPVDSHAALGIRALEAGKDVFIEKPLARSVADAEALCEVARDRQRILMVGHTFLFNPAVRWIKRAIDAGEVGEIRYIFCQRLNLGIVRQDVDSLWSLAPHDISMLDYWIGRDVTAMSGVGHSFLRPGIADVVFAHITYAGNIAGHIHVSWIDPSKVRRATIVGSQRMIIFDDVSAEAPITVFDKGVDLQEADSAGAQSGSFLQHQLALRWGDSRIPRIVGREPLVAEMEEFAECIAQRRQSIADGDNGLRVVRTLAALTRAMQP